MVEYLSLDETSLSKGELYTYLTNKSGKGKKGTLVASIKGTKSKDIITWEYIKYKTIILNYRIANAS